VAVALAWATGAAHAQGIDGPGFRAPIAPGPGTEFAPVRRGNAGLQPVVIDADVIFGRPDLDTTAVGKVEFRRMPLTLKADRIDYTFADDLVRAKGNVSVEREGNKFTGPELQLHVERFEGYFLSPSYTFAANNSGGSAQRFDFIDDKRAIAIGATYTTCEPEDPAWILQTRRVRLDFEENEGIAEGAVVKFYGVPILAFPVLSFPLSDARKSGWLPPTINFDTKSGFAVAVPYYWNIAPNRDATITPVVFSRRGAGAETEFRYLEPNHRGVLQFDALPDDRLTGTTRWSTYLNQDGLIERKNWGAIDYGLDLQRASDDAYWKDFPHALPSLTPRLLPTDGHLSRRFDSDWGNTLAYVHVQKWQVLQDPDPASAIVAPYERAPQIGLSQRGRLSGGLEWRWETEVNRFINEDPTRLGGTRTHALGTLEWPWQPLGTPGWTITPRVTVNSAYYDYDQLLKVAGQPAQITTAHAGRTIPTYALDSAWVFERDAKAFGRDFTQTLEPRLLYVNTPYHDQSNLPNFDAAANDFNVTSVYADNPFSGIDRVADVHQVSAGVTTRFLERSTGAELLRLGAVQRVLLRDQRVTPDGIPITQRYSDLLLLGSTSLVPSWVFDTSVQYSAEQSRLVRSVVAARYNPGPYQTLSLAYSYNQNTTRQFDVGWQWPLNAAARDHAAATKIREQLGKEAAKSVSAPSTSGQCRGAWYSVGHVRYSRIDGRITDAIAGFEYDSGCWIARVVAERLSTGQTESTTRLLLQLELVGLSRLGSNPLQALRDNIPGYRLLRDERSSPFQTSTP